MIPSFGSFSLLHPGELKALGCDTIFDIGFYPTQQRDYFVRKGRVGFWIDTQVVAVGYFVSVL